MKSRPVKSCPKCRKPRARRLLSAGAGLLFKGSGFYTTDYRSASYKKAASSDRPDGGSAAVSKDGSRAADKPASDKPSTDKPAAKPDTKTESKSKTETKTEKHSKK